MATTPQTASAAPAAARSRLSSRQVLLLACAGLLAAGLGGALFFTVPGATVHAAAPVEASKPIFVALEPVTVNLQSAGKPKFLHLGVSLKVGDERTQGRLAEVLPEMRSRLLLLLSNRDAATLTSAADKAALAEEIRADLSRPVAKGAPAYELSGVVFNTFVVQ